jgi:hypothetical protein
MKRPILERFAPAILIVSCALLFYVVFRSQFALLRQQDPGKTRIYEDEMNDGGKKLLTDAHRVDGTYSFNEQGLVLAPGQKARIVYTFSKEPLTDVWIELRVLSYPYLSNEVRITRPDMATPYIARNMAFFAGIPQNLTDFLRGATQFTLTLSAESEPDAPQPRLVFDSMRLIFAERVALPSVALFVSITSAVLLLWYWLGSLGRFVPLHAFLFCEAFLIAFLVFVGSVRIPYDMGELIIFPPTLLLLSRFLRTKDAHLRQRCIFCAFLIILWVGTQLRWALFMQRQNVPIEPDCDVYLSLAKRLPSLFDTDFREPLFIWMVRVFTSLTAPNGLNLRLMTVILSILCIYATYQTGRRLLGNAPALLASLAVAISPLLIYYAQGGLRLELTILTVLPFYYLAMRKSPNPTLSESLELGSWAGLNLLNVLSSYVFTVPLMVYKAIRDRFAWWKMTLAILLSFLIVTPHLVHNKKQFDDFFYSVNIHAKYYRNREFAGRPGFPTLSEVIKDGYAGPPTTTFHYIFGMHSLSDVLVSSIKGWWWIYIAKFADRVMLNFRFIIVPYILGIILLLLEPRRDMLLGYFLLAAGLFFVVGKLHQGVPTRLTDYIAPVGFLIAGYGIVRITRVVGELAKALSRASSKQTRRAAERRAQKR